MSQLPSEYGPLLDSLSKVSLRKCQPVEGTFELTTRCNLNCGICYIHDLCEDNSEQLKELSAIEWVRMASEAVEHGLVFLLLSGGEPFVRTDFWEIYEPIRRMGLILALFTNGTLITRETANRLAKMPPNRLEITLYGASESIYEQITGTKGSYNRCMSGIENLRTAGVPLILKTTLTKENLGELETMRSMAHQWGAVFRYAWLLTKRRDGQYSNAENSRLSYEEVIELEQAQKTVSSMQAGKGTDTLPLGAFECGAGQNSFHLTAKGEMNVCIDFPYPSVRPLRIGFDKAWKALTNFATSEVPISACNSCELKSNCPQCPAFLWLESGDTTTPAPYFCAIARARRDQMQKRA